MKRARELLYLRFLPNNGSVKISSPGEEPLAHFLTAEGALKRVGPREYEVLFVHSLPL